MEKNALTLASILEALEVAGAGHAVFGGLAASFYGRHRPAKDVDLLVPGSCVKNITVALARRGYTVREYGHVTKIYLPGEANPAADLLALETNGMLRAAFAATVTAMVLGMPVRVVERGVFVALKFEAAATPRRHPRRRIRDLSDIHAVFERGFEQRDELLALQIANRMYPGAVADLARMIDDVRHGRQPRIPLCAGPRTTLLRHHGIAASARRRALSARF